MKAEIYSLYGPPEVDSVKEIAKPIPTENEVLIKILASTVNRTDSGFRSAEYFVSRFWSGLFKPKFKTLGCEFAGIIEQIGSNVSNFKIDDKVFGYNDQSFGGHAEYVCVNESSPLTQIPTNLNIYESAPITEGAHYALNTIKASKISRGQNALVYGATGAIGSAAVQLLKHLGAHVTAVCNTKNIDLVRSLGADEVIDYQTQDFTNTNTKFQFAFDAVGKSSFKQCKPLLSENGIYISTELGKHGANIWLALVTPFLGGKKVLFPIPSIHKNDLLFFKSLIENGKFKPVIDRYYNLDEIVDAYRYVETGQKTGNVILKIAE